MSEIENDEIEIQVIQSEELQKYLDFIVSEVDLQDNITEAELLLLESFVDTTISAVAMIDRKRIKNLISFISLHEKIPLPHYNVKNEDDITFLIGMKKIMQGIIALLSTIKCSNPSKEIACIDPMKYHLLWSDLKLVEKGE